MTLALGGFGAAGAEDFTNDSETEAYIAYDENNGEATAKVKNGNTFGGYSNSGETISGKTATVDDTTTAAYGGYSYGEGASVSGNTLTLTGTAEKWAVGGVGYAGDGTGTASAEIPVPTSTFTA